MNTAIADVDDDGEVTVIDAMKILQEYVDRLAESK